MKRPELFLTAALAAGELAWSGGLPLNDLCPDVGIRVAPLLPRDTIIAFYQDPSNHYDIGIVTAKVRRAAREGVLVVNDARGKTIKSWDVIATVPG